MSDIFHHQRLTAPEAESIRAAFESLLTRTNPDGTPIPHSTRVEALRYRGGYQISIPAEHARQLLAAYQRRAWIRTDIAEPGEMD